jgi:hypothetical protein
VHDRDEFKRIFSSAAVSSVDIRFHLSLYKCFIVEKTLSICTLQQEIENKKEIHLCKLGEGVGLTDKSIPIGNQILFLLLHYL